MIQVFFAPGDDPRYKIMDEINASGSTLDIAQSYWTDQYIWYTIEDALARGVQVRLLLDRHSLNSPWSVYKLYIKGNVIPGLTTRISKIKGYMHNHFIILDNDNVLTGSYNWTFYAATRNDEDLVFLISEPLQYLYADEFQRLWEEAA